MSGSRLSHALDSGALVLPDGPVAVFGPPAGYDLSALPGATVVTRFYPDKTFWERAGHPVLRTPEGRFAAALVVLPRAKPAARAMIAEARAVTDGPVLIDGQKTDGVDSILKAVKAICPPEGVISKSHGKLFWITGGDFTDWGAQPTAVAGGFITRPGVFSADGPDKGSQLLAAALPTDLKGRVADLGAGWGFLAPAVLASDKVTRLDLIEADAVALDCARENVSDPRAMFHWADAITFEPDATVDIVVTNPPFHISRAGNPEIGRAFLRAAARMLTPAGTLFMVANRHLPYEADLARLFREHAEIAGDGGFKVIRASRPIARRGDLA